METEDLKHEPQELAVVHQSVLTAQLPDEDIYALAEKRVMDVQKALTLSLKVTNTQDWVDQNGRPYLGASGAEKVARLFGISWKFLKCEKIVSSDERGSFYFYQVTGIFALRNDRIEAVGTCSVKDAFFGRAKGEQKPASEIDETNIMKSAYTNCVANGVTRLLGLRNLTWDQVNGSGLKREAVAKVDYAAGGAGGGLISEAQQKRCFAILMHGAKEDKAEREKTFKTFLAENYKIESSKEIRRIDYDLICQTAEKIAMDFNEKF